MGDLPSSVYLHFPFCARKCFYCDFPSYAGRLGDIDRYLRALEREIRQAGTLQAPGLPPTPLQTVYVGGGTPTLAGAERMVELLDTLRAVFPWATDAEVTVETNPGTVHKADFERMRRGGINRISFGLQAWQPSLLKRLGRIHTAEDFVEAFTAARKAGFDNLSADLMLGLPGQTLGDVRETVSRVIDIGADHVSFYSLQIEEGTPFYDWYESGELILPDEEIERAMYHETRRLLRESGREPYEISSAALPGRACRHNLTYWRAEEYFGFGCAAHGYFDRVRRANHAALDDYLQAVEHGDTAPFPASQVLETLDRDAQMKEVMMLAFRTDAGVDAASYTRRFGETPDERFGETLASLVIRGLIAETPRGWALTGRGLDFANQVFMEFV
jgi:oxygen-independent coproporphyrinogen-3 oxidase